ncbi:MAG: hypothetical protein ACKO6B_17350 [Planctomycetia bacterium]
MITGTVITSNASHGCACIRLPDERPCSLPATGSRKDTMNTDEPKTMVRFDFPPGATPEEIAAAIRSAGARLMKERDEALTRTSKGGTIPPKEKGQVMAEYETYDREKVYQELYERFTRMEVPACTHCHSGNTASVQVGVIGLTIRLAATCRKFKLIGNGPKPGEWFCNSCHKFFNKPDGAPEGATP